MDYSTLFEKFGKRTIIDLLFDAVLLNQPFAFSQIVQSIQGNVDKYKIQNQIFETHTITILTEDSKYYLLDNGYIKQVSELLYTLTDKGILAKELGGIDKYQVYRYRELNAYRNQNVINVLLVIAALAGALSPMITEWIKQSFKKPEEIVIKNPAQVISVKLDSSSIKQLIRHDTVFIKINQSNEKN